MINEALSEIASLRDEAEQNGLKFIVILCEVGEIRILSRIPNSQDKVAHKINNLRDRISLNPEYESLSWLVDLSEIFVKNQKKDLGRIDALIKRNSENVYLQKLGKSILNKVKFEDLTATEDLPEITAFDVISKNLKLSKFEHKGVKKQSEYLRRALEAGEKAGAREIFLRQDNSTLEAIISLPSERDSLWLESLNRLAIERIKERNWLVEISGEQLTTREIEVLKYLVTENSISEIGQILHISKNTMKTHLRNIYRKLGVDGRGAAAKKAKENLII
jgi:DNA-binding CsgD family transcriptional regulator